MSNFVYYIVFLCAFLIAIGQLLFKSISNNYNETLEIFNFNVLGLLVIAGILYCGATILWIWCLRYVDLSKAYPIFALGFALVPFMSWLIFKESMNIYYIIGVILIIIGISLTVYQ